MSPLCTGGGTSWVIGASIPIKWPRVEWNPCFQRPEAWAMAGVVIFLGQLLASLRSEALVWAPQSQQKDKGPTIHKILHASQTISGVGSSTEAQAIVSHICCCMKDNHSNVQKAHISHAKTQGYPWSKLVSNKRLWSIDTNRCWK